MSEAPSPQSPNLTVQTLLDKDNMNVYAKEEKLGFPQP